MERTRPRLSTRSADRNKAVPSELTETFINLIRNLSPSLKNDYLKSEFMSKFVSDDTDPPEVRRTRAINKWLATEKENEATNERLILTPSEYNILPRVTFEEFVNFCRDLVVEIVGETVPVDALIGSFSGGASTSRKRTESHPAGKYLGKAHATQRALDIFNDIVKDEIPAWCWDCYGFSIEVVPGNVMFTVPKKTDIDRCACKEPDINMFMQKGVGNYFRDSLRKIGINLNDQTKNRSLAREGSIHGRLATLDLSSASDSVTTGLVYLLLPVTWFTLLDSLRCPVTIIDGEMHSNEMFSSMGNGFTFELESLLFYVLTRATCYFTGTSGIVSVYGDDIICPSSVVPYLSWVLSYFGFQVNPDKSFATGTFRESCGGHYDCGIDITPFYLRGPLRRLTDVVDIANKLRQWGSFAGTSVIDPEIYPIWAYLKDFIPKVLWGGVDTSFKYQLVSNDEPSMRLQPERRQRKAGAGGYLHWLNTTWDRSALTEGVSTSTVSEERTKFRLRPALKSTVTRLHHLFYEEIVAPSMVEE